MTEIGAAIVGCGNISTVHAQALFELEGVQLRAVVDTDLDRARFIGREYGCEALGDIQLLTQRSDIQVVHVCTPHHLHVQMALMMLRSGKHVLTEKPMSHTLEEGRQLLEVASASSLQLGVCFQNRYNESSIRIKEMTSSGELGRMLGMKAVLTWYREEAYYTKSPWRGRWATEGGGVLINQAIHTLDLLQWFGGEIATVHGSVTTDALEHCIEVEDTAHARICFANGATAIFYATNGYIENSPLELEVVFEEGRLILRSHSLFLQKDGQETLLCGPPTYDGFTGKSYWGISHAHLIQHYYQCLKSGTPFPIDALEGLKAIQLIHAIYES